MATSLIHYGKQMKRTESRKSHSWWWDSHVSPKNSKWLSENLEEMEKSVKRMLKLIEEEGDSFAKKAEMYYQRRPELVCHVEEFYRMYRSLAERYDHVTGELRRSIPSDLQSQGSTVSDSGSDFPSPDQRLSRRKSGGNPRPAGFDFFLGSDHESSTLTDSDADSDDSSVINYSSSDQPSQRKIVELEIELRDARDKLRLLQEDHHRPEDPRPSIARYEQELSAANDEISRLSAALRSGGSGEAETSDDRGLVEELRVAKGKLRVSENEVDSLRYELERNKERIRQLQTQLESGQKEAIASKAKLNAEKREVAKLHERVSRLKGSLSDRDREVLDLKIAVSDAEEKIFPEKAQVKAEISKLIGERARLVDQARELENRGRCLEDEIRTIRAEGCETEARLTVEIESLKREAVEKGDLIESLRTERDGLRARVSSLDAEAVRRDERIDRLGAELRELEKGRSGLIAEVNATVERAEDLESRIRELEREIERQRAVISDGEEKKREAIRQLCFSIEHYRESYNTLRQAFTGHKRVPVLAS